MSADANTVSIAFSREASYGVLKDPAVFSELRYTGESLAHAKDTVRSEEIRSDRQVPDLVLVGSQASGAFNFELSRDEYLPFFEALLCGTWADVAVAATANISLSGQTLTGSAGDFDDVPVGGWLKVTGASAPTNNGLKRCIAKNANGSVLTFAAGSFTADQSGASLNLAGRDLRNGSTRRSYTFERKVVNSAGGTVYQTYAGCMIGKGNLSVESKKIVTGSFEVLGKYGETSGTSLNVANAATGTLTATGNPSADQTVTIGTHVYTFKASLSGADQVLIGATASDTLDNLIAAINGAAGEGTTYGTGTVAHTDVEATAGAGDTMVVTAVETGTDGNAIATTDTSAVLAWGASTLTDGVDAAYVAPTTNPILNGTNHLGTFHFGNGAATDRFKMLSLAVDNSLRGRDALGEAGNFDIGLGSFMVTGRVSAYFHDNTLYNALIDHEDKAISIVLTDDDGDQIAFTFPRVKFGTGNPNATAINTDVMLDIDFTAILDPESLATMIVNTFDA